MTRRVPASRKLRFSHQGGVSSFQKSSLVGGTFLYDICYSAALSKPSYGQVMDAFVAQNLLSLILVYDTNNPLLVMSHLVGPDTLPPKEYLEPV